MMTEGEYYDDKLKSSRLFVFVLDDPGSASYLFGSASADEGEGG